MTDSTPQPAVAPVTDEVRGVLSFWFEELEPRQWFEKDDALDRRIRERFLVLYERLAVQGAGGWAHTAHGALAAVIVLDQFPRNMFRGDARSFASDALALTVAEQAIGAGLDAALDATHRKFLYMPFEHSEDAAMQARSVALFAALGDADSLDYALRHKQVIDRFGRFPHRNALLGRSTTAEEAAFLEKPGSAF